ncbi:hypothetical protein [Krasilnikovia sp. M28-CT-15]
MTKSVPAAQPLEESTVDEGRTVLNQYASFDWLIGLAHKPFWG